MAPRNNIQYIQPQVPLFLRKLQIQVSTSSSSSPSFHTKSDDLNDLLSGSTSSKHNVNQDQDDDDDDEEEAQIVVLNDSKHLSRDQVNSLRQESKKSNQSLPSPSPSSSLKSVPISTVGVANSSKKRTPIQTSDQDISSTSTFKKSKLSGSTDLADVKQMIQAERGRKKGLERDKKNKQAKKQIKKSGQGLSFSLQDE